MPAYCTVFSALFAVIRASRLRVSPNETVRERDPLSDTVPGISMQLREAFPYSGLCSKTPLTITLSSGAGWNAAVLNHSRCVCGPLMDVPGARSGRRELGAPAFTSAGVRAYVGVAQPPEAKAKFPEIEYPSRIFAITPPLLRKARFGPKGGSMTKVPLN